MCKQEGMFMLLYLEVFSWLLVFLGYVFKIINILNILKVCLKVLGQKANKDFV